MNLQARESSMFGDDQLDAPYASNPQAQGFTRASALANLRTQPTVARTEIGAAYREGASTHWMPSVTDGGKQQPTPPVRSGR